MSRDESHCTLYGHSWVHQPTLHAYICDECGRMVTEADLDDADIPRLGNRRRLFADDCDVFGHVWQEYRPPSEALFYTGLYTCRRCGVTRPTEDRYFAAPEPPRTEAGEVGRNLTEVGFESLLGQAGRANASVIRTTYLDEIQPPGGFTWGRSVIDRIERPPICAPLDHKWIKPPLGAPEEECRHCRRTRKEVEDA